MQYAIQGKLVPQDPNDEPAHILLKKIKAEKQELVKQGKLKEEKPLPPITVVEIPFEIPDSWIWTRLNEAFLIILGQSPEGNSVTTNSKGTEFHQGKVYFGKKLINKSNETTIKPSKIAPANSVLLCVRAPVGKVNITNRELCIGRGLCSISPLANISIDFIYYILKTYEEVFIRQATGTTFISITGEVVKNQLFPLPPLAEQQRIVARIEELMALVDEYEKKEMELATLEKEFPEKLKKSILQYAVQGKLTKQIETDEPANILLKKIKAEKQELVKQGKLKKEKSLLPITEDEIPFDVPNTWEWVRLGEVGITNIGLTYKPSDIVTNSSGIIVLRSSNIQNEKICYADLIRVSMEIPENKKCIRGDLLICARNGSKKLVGKSAIIYEDGMSFGAFMAIFRSQCNQYIHKYMNTPFFRTLLGDSNTTTINQITQDMLNNFIFSLPPLAEQQRIVARIEELFTLVEMLSSTKKVKIAEVKAMPIYNNENDTLNIPQKRPFDIASLQLAARQEDDVDEETIDDVKKQVQEYYAKKN